MSLNPSNQNVNHRSQCQATQTLTSTEECDVGDNSLSGAQSTPEKRKRKKHEPGKRNILMYSLIKQIPGDSLPF